MNCQKLKMGDLIMTVSNFLFILLYIVFLVWIVNIETDLCFIRKSLKEFKEKEDKKEYKENEELKEAIKSFLENF